MLFNSRDFLFKFLPVVFAGYLLLLRVSRPLRKILLAISLTKEIGFISSVNHLSFAS